jgi:hypothetical protein
MIATLLYTESVVSIIHTYMYTSHMCICPILLGVQMSETTKVEAKGEVKEYTGRWCMSHIGDWLNM